MLKDKGELPPRLEQAYYDAFQICVCHGNLARARKFAFLATEQKRLRQEESAPDLNAPCGVVISRAERK